MFFSLKKSSELTCVYQCSNLVFSHRVFRAGMLNVTVSSLSGEEQALVRTIIVHENYRQQTPDISPTVEANNIGKR